MERFELLTPCLQGRCSPNWATPPWMRAFPLSRRSLIHFCSVFISISQSLPALPFWVMGLSGLEPPTSRLSGVRSNRLSYKPIESGIHLLSHAVSSIVPSADQVLTVVFGMGTGVSPDRIDTRILVLSVPPAVLSESSYGASLPKPFRTVRQYDLSVTQIWKSKGCLSIESSRMTTLIAEGSRSQRNICWWAQTVPSGSEGDKASEAQIWSFWWRYA